MPKARPEDTLVSVSRLPKVLMMAASILAIVGAVLLAMGLSQMESSTERGCPPSTSPGTGSTCDAAMDTITLSILVLGLCAALALASRAF